MKQQSTNEALDRWLLKTRLRKFGIIAALICVFAAVAATCSVRAETEYRFVEVIGARFQADNTSPNWRIETRGDDGINYFSSSVYPGPMKPGEYICVNVQVSSGFGIGGLGIVPDRMCNRYGVFAPTE